MADILRGPSWATLPSDPALPPHAPLTRRLTAAFEQGRLTGAADLPAVSGLSPLVFARWLYRGWLESQPRWRAFVHIDPARLDAPRSGRSGIATEQRAAALSDSFEQAAGGWLLLDLGWESLDDRAALAARAQGLGIRLLLATPGPPEPIPAELSRRISRLDPLHLIATDPSLTLVRRSLLGHCRAAGVVHLHGPVGTGKRSLCRWAHATQDDRPLHRVQAGQSAPPAGAPLVTGWQVFEEVTAIAPPQLAPLRERLAGAVDPWPASAPRGLGAEPTSRPDDDAFKYIIGDSPALRRVLHKAARYAPSALPLLVRGPTGSGKELLARAVHHASGRRGKLVSVDLNAVTEGLLESALFGHVKGAFTGADRERAGALRDARGGTLFLDELGNLSLGVQAKLLRVLETRMVQPVGSDQVFPVDVRVVAATNADLEGMVARGEFREDLLFRFNPAATLWLPPLSERPEDLPALARRFVAETLGVDEGPELHPDVVGCLMDHGWPGNIRELRHVMEAAAIESGGQTIRQEHLGDLGQRGAPSPLLVTSSHQDLSATPAGLPRDLWQQICAVTMTLPAVAERSSIAVRSAILGQLGGRPIRAEALASLENRPWWGNYSELSRAMEAVRGNIEGVIDSAALQRSLPHLLQGEGRAPIHLLMFPILSANGEVAGLRQVFHEGAVLIGRVGSLGEVIGGPGGGDSRLERRRETLRRLLGPIQPGFLRLDHVIEVSRAHLLLLRDGPGTVVHLMPDVGLQVWAGPIEGASRPDGQWPLHLVTADEPVDIGPAGEIQIRLAGAEGFLVRLFVTAGAVALEEYRSALRARLSPAHATQVGARPAVASPPAGQSAPPAPPAAPLPSAPDGGPPANRVWVLDAAERAAMNEIILHGAQRGGSFSSHLHVEGRRLLFEPKLRRLGQYLDSRHPTQSASRLYLHEPNEPLRVELAERLEAAAEGPELWERLPKNIRGALPGGPA